MMPVFTVCPSHQKLQGIEHKKPCKDTDHAVPSAGCPILEYILARATPVYVSEAGRFINEMVSALCTVIVAMASVARATVYALQTPVFLHAKYFPGRVVMPPVAVLHLTF